MRWRRLAWAALCLLTAAPAFADVAELTARYQRQPSAPVAIAVAEELMAKGNVGGAANWAERALANPDGQRAHARANKMLQQLRWPLRDAHYGLVEIAVMPDQSLVAVDDVPLLPRRPLYRVWLRSGSHQLIVTLHGYAPEDRVIDARAGEERRVQVALIDVRPASLVLDVQPVTAEVWIDGQYAGLSPKRQFSVRAGSRLLEVRADGFAPWTDALTLRPAEQRAISVTLTRAGAMRRNPGAYSNVDRPLTPQELANRGERHELGHAPHDRLRHRDPRPGVSGSADDAKPRQDEDAPRDGPAPPSRPDRTPAPPPIEAGEAPGSDVAAQGDVAPSAPWSSTLKGALWTGGGLALLGAGVGLAVVGADQAHSANALRLGDKGYASAYRDGQRLAWSGYGAAGLGAVAVGVGAIYWFGGDGLARPARGGLLAGVGAAAAGTGAWLMLTAASGAEEAASFAPGDVRYDAAYDGALASWRAGAAAAAVGGAAVLAGAWLLLTSSGPTYEAALVPHVGEPGLDLLVRF